MGDGSELLQGPIPAAACAPELTAADASNTISLSDRPPVGPLQPCATSATPSPTPDRLKITNQIWLRPGQTVHVDVSEASPVTYKTMPKLHHHAVDAMPNIQLSGSFSLTAHTHCVLQAPIPECPAFAAGWEKLSTELRCEVLKYVLIAEEPLDEETASEFFERFLYPLLKSATYITEMEVVAKYIFHGANTFRLNGLSAQWRYLSGRPTFWVAPFLRRVEFTVGTSSQEWRRHVQKLTERDDWPMVHLRLCVDFSYGLLNGRAVTKPERSVHENKEIAKVAMRAFFADVFGRRNRKLQFHCHGHLECTGSLKFGAETDSSASDSAALFQERMMDALRHRLLFK